MVEIENAGLSTQNWKTIGNKEKGKGELITIGIEAKSRDTIVDYCT